MSIRLTEIYGANEQLIDFASATVDQSMVDTFAGAKKNRPSIHVDPACAAAAKPFGGTVAHSRPTPSLRHYLSERMR